MNRQHQDVHPNILPFSKKEILARNRTKTGYNVYQSWFYHDWKLCSDDEQRGALIQYSVHSGEEYDDEDSVISDPAITAVDVLRLCAKYWGGLTELTRRAWQNRAILVNQLPVLGAFTAVPAIVDEKLVMLALTNEFDRISKLFKMLLKNNKTNIIEGMKVKQFGNEKVSVGTQVFKHFYINCLFSSSLFGDYFSSSSVFQDHEIVNRKKTCILVHINSNSRLNSIFTMNGINMLEYQCNDDDSDNNHLSKVVVGPKVIIRRRNTEQEMIGMVMDELENSYLSILFVNGERRRLKKPVFDRVLGVFRYLGMNCNDESDIEGDDDYVIVEYNPIRLAINKSGNVQIILSKFELSNTIHSKLRCV
jgi:hypothetical protein